MVKKRYDIAKYDVWFQEASRDFRGLLESPVRIVATVSCHPSDQSDFTLISYVFVDGDDLPADRVRRGPMKTIVYLFRAFKYLPYFVDLLRNEKPIVASVDLDTAECALGTSGEAVGED